MKNKELLESAQQSTDLAKSAIMDLHRETDDQFLSEHAYDLIEAIAKQWRLCGR
jgi:hypothetical protein